VEIFVRNDPALMNFCSGYVLSWFVVNGKRGNPILVGRVEVACQMRIEGLELAGRAKNMAASQEERSVQNVHVRR